MSHDFRLPRGARLRLGAQYKALRDHGTSARGSLFRLSVLRVKAENTCHHQASQPPRHDQHEICGLTRIFHTDHLRRPGKQMDPALDSHCDLGGMDTYSPASKCSSALTRSLPLVSPFQGCLKAVSPAVSRPPVVPHPPSRPPRHDQYEISGLSNRLAIIFIE